MALAATLVLAIAGLGAWLTLRGDPEQAAVSTTPVAPEITPPPTTDAPGTSEPAEAASDATAAAEVKKAQDTKRADAKRAEEAKKADAKRAEEAKKADAKRAEEAKKAQTRRADEAKASASKSSAARKPARKPPAVPAIDDETARSIAGARDSLKALDGLPPPPEDADEPVLHVREVGEPEGDSARVPAPPPAPEDAPSPAPKGTDPILRVTPAPDSPPLPD